MNCARSLVPTDRKSTRRSSAGSCHSSAGTSSMTPSLTERGSSPSIGRDPGALLVEQAFRRLELGDLADHRELDVQIAPGGGAQQGPQLLAQHRRPVEPDANRAPAHRRIVLGRFRQVWQYLVAADIERAEDDRPLAGLFKGAAVEIRLLGDLRETYCAREAGFRCGTARSRRRRSRRAAPCRAAARHSAAA